MSGETRACYQALPASVGDPGQITPSYQPGPVEIGKKKGRSEYGLGENGRCEIC